MKRQRLAPVLTLVQRRPDRETVELLEALLVKALAGELTGLAYVGSFGPGKYRLGIRGDLRSRPTFARGAVRALDDALAELLVGGGRGEVA